MYKGELKPFERIIVKPFTGDNEGVWAWTYDKHIEGKSKLEIHNLFPNEKHFVNVLSHEMLHLRADQKNQEPGHGQFFRRFGKRLRKKHGIHIGSNIGHTVTDDS